MIHIDAHTLPGGLEVPSACHVLRDWMYTCSHIVSDGLIKTRIVVARSLSYIDSNIVIIELFIKSRQRCYVL